MRREATKKLSVQAKGMHSFGSPWPTSIMKNWPYFGLDTPNRDSERTSNPCKPPPLMFPSFQNNPNIHLQPRNPSKGEQGRGCSMLLGHLPYNPINGQFWAQKMITFFCLDGNSNLLVWQKEHKIGLFWVHCEPI